MNVSMGTVTSPSGVSVDPLQPMLSAMRGDKILKVINNRDTLRLRSPKEVVLDWISVIAERNFDGALEAMDVTILAGPLICLVLPHEGQELFGGPPLGLEVVVV